MDSQMNSELLDKILDDDMISLSGVESDVDILGPDLGLNLEEDLDTTKPYSIIDELMDGPPTHHTKYQHSTFQHSTTFSNVSHSLSTMTTTTKHSTINTTSPTPTASHNDMRQNTTPAHTRITTTTNIPCHTLLKNTTSTHQNPHHQKHTSLCTPPKTSLPTTPNQLSTTKSKPKTTPCKHTSHEHLLFTFYFIPNRPNYISKLNLPMNLARLCTEIQHNAELSVIKIVEDYLTKQNKTQKWKQKQNQQ